MLLFAVRVCGTPAMKNFALKVPFSCECWTVGSCPGNLKIVGLAIVLAVSVPSCKSLFVSCVCSLHFFGRCSCIIIYIGEGNRELKDREKLTRLMSFIKSLVCSTVNLLHDDVSLIHSHLADSVRFYFHSLSLFGSWLYSCHICAHILYFGCT